MIRKLSIEGAYYIENNGHGVVRYNEGAHTSDSFRLYF